MRQLTITINSESEGTSGLIDSLREVIRGVEGGNRMWRGENDTESFEWSIIQTYGKDDGISF